MRWMRLVVLVPASFVLAMLQPAGASDADALMGVWQQVDSNAGACPTCSVEFRMHGPGLAVLANNGWFARLGGSGASFDGSGRWPDTGRTWVSGRPFTISFRLERERLEMVMTVDTSGGQKRVVRARYRRAWQGV